MKLHKKLLFVFILFFGITQMSSIVNGASYTRDQLLNDGCKSVIENKYSSLNITIINIISKLGNKLHGNYVDKDLAYQVDMTNSVLTFLGKFYESKKSSLTESQKDIFLSLQDLFVCKLEKLEEKVGGGVDFMDDLSGDLDKLTSGGGAGGLEDIDGGVETGIGGESESTGSKPLLFRPGSDFSNASKEDLELSGCDKVVTIGKYNVCHKRSALNATMYWRDNPTRPLYDEDTSKEACPDGFHAPSVNEFGDLYNQYGGFDSSPYFIEKSMGKYPFHFYGEEKIYYKFYSERKKKMLFNYIEDPKDFSFFVYPRYSNSFSRSASTVYCFADKQNEEFEYHFKFGENWGECINKKRLKPIYCINQYGDLVDKSLCKERTCSNDCESRLKRGYQEGTCTKENFSKCTKADKLVSNSGYMVNDNGDIEMPSKENRSKYIIVSSFDIERSEKQSLFQFKANSGHDSNYAFPEIYLKPYYDYDSYFGSLIPSHFHLDYCSGGESYSLNELGVPCDSPYSFGRSSLFSKGYGGGFCNGFSVLGRIGDWVTCKGDPSKCSSKEGGYIIDEQAPIFMGGENSGELVPGRGYLKTKPRSFIINSDNDFDGDGKTEGCFEAGLPRLKCILKVVNGDAKVDNKEQDVYIAIDNGIKGMGYVDITGTRRVITNLGFETMKYLKGTGEEKRLYKWDNKYGNISESIYIKGVDDNYIELKPTKHFIGIGRVDGGDKRVEARKSTNYIDGATCSKVYKVSGLNLPSSTLSCIVSSIDTDEAYFPGYDDLPDYIKPYYDVIGVNDKVSFRYEIHNGTTYSSRISGHPMLLVLTEDEYKNEPSVKRFNGKLEETYEIFGEDFTEECDDGNDIVGDGCTLGKIDHGYDYCECEESRYNCLGKTTEKCYKIDRSKEVKSKNYPFSEKYRVYNIDLNVISSNEDFDGDGEYEGCGEYLSYNKDKIPQCILKLVDPSDENNVAYVMPATQYYSGLDEAYKIRVSELLKDYSGNDEVKSAIEHTFGDAIWVNIYPEWGAGNEEEFDYDV